MNHLTDKELVSLFSTDKERAFNLFLSALLYPFMYVCSTDYG